MSHPGTRRHSSVSLRGVLLGIAIGVVLAWGSLLGLRSGEETDPSQAAAGGQPDFDSALADASEGDRALRASFAATSLEPASVLDGVEPGAAASTGGDRPLHSRRVSGQLDTGESLTVALARYGISQRTVTLIANALRPFFDFRRSRPGDSYQVEFDAEGKVVDFLYVNRRDQPLHVFWNGENYKARVETPRVEIRQQRIAGVIESNLYEAIAALGEDPQLANSFAEVFAWDLNFRRNVQSGDSFTAVYERRYQVGPGGVAAYAGLGRILAAIYAGKAGEFSAVYYKAAEKPSGYYRRDGTSLEGKFLFKPVEYGRVSSGWRESRRHPILKTTRPHYGIDWAAPRGTPVWAVASGTIVFRGLAGGRGGGFGNLVKIRHDNGYVSYYGHLHGYAGGLEVGDRVRQKQVIGYVGSTGLATGPHVCFRIKKAGRYVNPMKIKSAAGARVAREDWTDFQLKRDEILGVLDGSRLAANEPKPTI